MASPNQFTLGIHRAKTLAESAPTETVNAVRESLTDWHLHQFTKSPKPLVNLITANLATVATNVDIYDTPPSLDSLIRAFESLVLETTYGANTGNYISEHYRSGVPNIGESRYLLYKYCSRSEIPTMLNFLCNFIEREIAKPTMPPVLLLAEVVTRYATIIPFESGNYRVLQWLVRATATAASVPAFVIPRWVSPNFVLQAQRAVLTDNLTVLYEPLMHSLDTFYNEAIWTALATFSIGSQSQHRWEEWQLNVASLVGPEADEIFSLPDIAGKNLTVRVYPLTEIGSRYSKQNPSSVSEAIQFLVGNIPLSLHKFGIGIAIHFTYNSSEVSVQYEVRNSEVKCSVVSEGIDYPIYQLRADDENGNMAQSLHTVPRIIAAVTACISLCKARAEQE